MSEPQWISAGRARILKGSRPKWVMVGLEWDGPGVLLLASDQLSRGAWVLFGIVFLWQLPHFLAIAWIYREDYARAGFPMLPVVEPDGRSTGRQATLYCLALLPVSLAPTLVGMTGAVYFVAALVLSLLFLGLTVRFARTRNVQDAKRLFFGSIIYLPVLWVLMIAGRT